MKVRYTLEITDEQRADLALYIADSVGEKPKKKASREDVLGWLEMAISYRLELVTREATRLRESGDPPSRTPRRKR